MVQSTVRDYLTENEEIKRSWRGSVKSGDESSSTTGFNRELNGTSFAATNQRLVYVNESESFKDIDYKHISSVEAEKSTEEEASPLQMIFIASIIGTAIGFFMLIDGNLLGLLLLLGSLGVFVLIAKMVEDPEQLFEVDEKTKYDIKLITGDEAHTQIAFETEENIGADLSRIVREYNQT